MNEDLEPRGSEVFDSRRVLLGCSASWSQMDAVVRLVQSIRWFGGAISELPFVALVEGGAGEAPRSLLRELNASVHEVAPGSMPAAAAELLDTAAGSPWDWIVMLPPDSVVLRDPSAFLESLDAHFSNQSPMSSVDECPRAMCVMRRGDARWRRAASPELDFHSSDAPADRPAAWMSCDPAVIHYGSGVLATGLLLPTAFPLAMVRIEDFNRRLQRELDHPGRRVTIRPVRPGRIPGAARPQVQVAVVGMHRSGTSTVAGALAVAGCHAGSGDDFRDADEFNERGYFEHRAVWAVNEALMELAGVTWYSPEAIEPEMLPQRTVAGLSTYASGIVREFDAGERPWLIKDPRLCLTFRFWRTLLSRPFVVLPFRDPLEVARSIQKRNGLPVPYGLALWELYNREALHSSHGLPRCIVSYRDLVADPEGTLSSLIREMAVVYPDAAVLEHGLSAAIVSVDPALRHQKTDDAQLDAALNVAQRRLYDALRSGTIDDYAGEPLSEGAAALLDAVDRFSFSETEARAALRGGLVIGELPRVNRELAGQLAAATDRVQVLERELNERVEDTERLRSAIAGLEAERARLLAEVHRAGEAHSQTVQLARSMAGLISEMLESRTWRVGDAVIRTGRRILRRRHGDSAARQFRLLQEKLDGLNDTTP